MTCPPGPFPRRFPPKRQEGWRRLLHSYNKDRVLMRGLDVSSKGRRCKQTNSLVVCPFRKGETLHKTFLTERSLLGGSTAVLISGLTWPVSPVRGTVHVIRKFYIRSVRWSHLACLWSERPLSVTYWLSSFRLTTFVSTYLVRIDRFRDDVDLERCNWVRVVLRSNLITWDV